MAQDIGIAIWDISTNQSDRGLDLFGAQDFGRKLAIMKIVIQQAHYQLKTMLPPPVRRVGGGWSQVSARSPQYLFVAPEYYFKASNTERCCSEANHNELKNEFRQLSLAACRDMVIIPGTMTWKKSLNEQRRKKAQLRTINVSTHLDKLGMHEDAHSWAQRASYFTGGHGHKNPPSHVAYNTAYVFFNGNIQKYHKMLDVGELLPEDHQQGAMFVTGGKQGYFVIGGNRYGLEICGDHDAGMLRRDVDIHVVTSASVRKKNSRACFGGLFVHADDASAPEVSKKTATGEISVAQGGQETADANLMLGSPSVDKARESWVDMRMENLRQRMPDEAFRRLENTSKDKSNRDFNQAALRGTLRYWVTTLDSQKPISI